MTSSPSLPPLVVYHKNCLDGTCAAYIAHMFFEECNITAEYMPLDYSEREQVFTIPLAGRDVYILDFSFTPEQTLRIAQEASSLIWLDHHQTAIESWNCPTPENAHITLDIERSGCGLAWDYFFPEDDCSHIVEAIEDRDLWRFKYPDTKAICAYMQSLPTVTHSQSGWEDWTDWESAFDGYDESPRLTVSYGNLLLREQRVSLAKALGATAMSCSISGNKGRCANLPPQFASDAGNQLATESGTYGGTWFINNLGQVKWSLRSVGNYDVAVIAQRYGGGGHKNAAGFTITLKQHLEILNER